MVKIELRIYLSQIDKFFSFQILRGIFFLAGKGDEEDEIFLSLSLSLSLADNSYFCQFFLIFFFRFFVFEINKVNNLKKKFKPKIRKIRLK